MNNINFENGLHLSLETMQFLQNAYKQPLSWLGNAITIDCIVCGVELTNSGSSVTDGAVCIGGELLPFVGGTKKTYCVIKNSYQSVGTQSGTQAEHALNTRYVEMADSIGSGETGVKFDSLLRYAVNYERGTMGYWNNFTPNSNSSIVTSAATMTGLGFKYEESGDGRLIYTIKNGRLLITGALMVSAVSDYTFATFDTSELKLSHDVVFVMKTFRNTNIYSDEFFILKKNGELALYQHPDSTLSGSYIVYAQAQVVNLD